jgi:hypothetical protein
LLVELGGVYRRASVEARRKADEAEETLRTLHEEHHETADAALPVVEERFQPLIDAEIIAVTIEQAKARVARHRLALVDRTDGDPDGPNLRLAHELALEAALDELDPARAEVSALQEEKRAAVYHYSHPNAEKSKRLGKQLAKRFARRH